MKIIENAVIINCGMCPHYQRGMETLYGGAFCERQNKRIYPETIDKNCPLLDIEVYNEGSSSDIQCIIKVKKKEKAK